MSEHITHVAICDDTRRVALQLDDLPAEFVRAWSQQIDASRMGGVTRQADNWSAQVIHDLRVDPSQPDHDRKLAFILGALTHRSIDRHMKPVFTFFKQAIDARSEAGRAVNECTIYCDLLILREVFATDDTFSAHLFDGKLAAGARPLQEVIRAMLQRTLIQMHTFKPAAGDVHGWMSSLFAGMQDFKLRLELYDQAAAHPDPAKWQRYLIDTHFYSATDPLIHCARMLQQGEPVCASDIHAAIVGTDQTGSRYARAMKRAIEYIRAAAELYRGKITLPDALLKLDIGVPELAMDFRL